MLHSLNKPEVIINTRRSEGEGKDGGRLGEEGGEEDLQEQNN